MSNREFSHQVDKDTDLADEEINKLFLWHTLSYRVFYNYRYKSSARFWHTWRRFSDKTMHYQSEQIIFITAIDILHASLVLQGVT